MRGLWALPFEFNSFTHGGKAVNHEMPLNDWWNSKVSHVAETAMGGVFGCRP
jgi:hypothetical protein